MLADGFVLVSWVFWLWLLLSQTWSCRWLHLDLVIWPFWLWLATPSWVLWLSFVSVSATSLTCYQFGSADVNYKTCNSVGIFHPFHYLFVCVFKIPVSTGSYFQTSNLPEKCKVFPALHAWPKQATQSGNDTETYKLRQTPFVSLCSGISNKTNMVACLENFLLQKMLTEMCFWRHWRQIL